VVKEEPKIPDVINVRDTKRLSKHHHIEPTKHELHLVLSRISTFRLKRQVETSMLQIVIGRKWYCYWRPCSPRRI